LTAAVKRRLVADREMCVYLSGGVDSTIICGIASSLGHPLTPITIGFGDHPLSEEGKSLSNHGIPYNLRPLADAAAKTAQHYSLQHERVNFTSEDAARLAIKAIYHTETPLVNPHSVAGLRLSEFAHEKGFVVALTGEGSDELHLGYSLFYLDILLEMRSHGQEPAKKSERLVKDSVKETKGEALLLGALPKDNPR
jgi:asparagine synthase (glutamine-hydrolysing)